MTAARSVGMLFAVATVLAGCGLLQGAVSGPGFQGGGSCGDMPGGACQEQFDRAGARHPGATQVDVACTAPVCDRKGGAGTVVVTLANGAKVNETFAYTGDATPLPVPSCTGLAFDICQKLAQAQADGVAPSRRIVSIEVTCTALPCTTDKGTADVTVTLGDGSKEQGGTSWEGSLP